MLITKTKLDSVCVIDPNISEDRRGLFVKTFNNDFFRNKGLVFSSEESYYSVSNKIVVRGLHFQIPPMDHTKFVYVTKGTITDVILDIRNNSSTYGKYIEVELSDKNRKAVFIPPGFAHGFLSLENNTCVVYSQSSVYSKDHDCGIKFDSIGINWDFSNMIISERDNSFPVFDNYKSPFIYST